MNEIRKSYTEDEIVQRIILAKLNGLQKVSYNITKYYFKFELGDCQILNNLLYVKTRLYIPLNKDNMRYTLIIKEVNIFLLGGHAGQSFINNYQS